MLLQTIFPPFRATSDNHSRASHQPETTAYPTSTPSPASLTLHHFNSNISSSCPSAPASASTVVGASGTRAIYHTVANRPRRRTLKSFGHGSHLHNGSEDTLACAIICCGLAHSGDLECLRCVPSVGDEEEVLHVALDLRRKAQYSYTGAAAYTPSGLTLLVWQCRRVAALMP